MPQSLSFPKSSSSSAWTLLVRAASSEEAASARFIASPPSSSASCTRHRVLVVPCLQALWAGSGTHLEQTEHIDGARRSCYSLPCTVAVSFSIVKPLAQLTSKTLLKAQGCHRLLTTHTHSKGNRECVEGSPASCDLVAPGQHRRPLRPQTRCRCCRTAHQYVLPRTRLLPQRPPLPLPPPPPPPQQLSLSRHRRLPHGMGDWWGLDSIFKHATRRLRDADTPCTTPPPATQAAQHSNIK